MRGNFPHFSEFLKITPSALGERIVIYYHTLIDRDSEFSLVTEFTLVTEFRFVTELYIITP